MAPSTACSASLHQGAWRPAYSRSVEETAGDADVIPGRSLPFGVAEQGSRMVGNNNRDAAESGDVVAQGAAVLLRVQEGLRRRVAHGEDYRGLEDLDLPMQVRHAG